MDPGIFLGLLDDGGLSVRTGRRKTHLERSVIVDRRPFDHRMDGIPVADGFAQSFEQNHSGAIADHDPARLRIKGAALTVGR